MGSGGREDVSVDVEAEGLFLAGTIDDDGDGLAVFLSGVDVTAFTDGVVGEVSVGYCFVVLAPVE